LGFLLFKVYPPGAMRRLITVTPPVCLAGRYTRAFSLPEVVLFFQILEWAFPVARAAVSRVGLPSWGCVPFQGFFGKTK
jgi:hypothetical protein